MTPPAWYEYAARVLERERGRTVVLGSDIEEAMALLRDTPPRARVYYHHPRCTSIGPWPHVRCPLP